MIYDSKKLTVELVTGRKVVMYYNPDPKTVGIVRGLLNKVDQVWKDDRDGVLIIQGLNIRISHILTYRVDPVKTFRKSGSL